MKLPHKWGRTRGWYIGRPETGCGRHDFAEASVGTRIGWLGPRACVVDEYSNPGLHNQMVFGGKQNRRVANYGRQRGHRRAAQIDQVSSVTKH